VSSSLSQEIHGLDAIRSHMHADFSIGLAEGFLRQPNIAGDLTPISDLTPASSSS
jgi:hypothetical protein